PLFNLGPYLLLGKVCAQEPDTAIDNKTNGCQVQVLFDI
ncbi:unnamed protein product, partial [marine sediment metagenome]